MASSSIATPARAEAAIGVRRGARAGCSDVAPASSGLSAKTRDAREQRADDLERRVLGRGADQRDGAVLDERQDRVLLGLVEAMDLVDEQHGAPASGVAPVAGLGNAARRSATPEETADTGTNAALVLDAMIRASVVFPVPGGPQRIIEGRLSASTRRRRILPSADQVLLADVLIERSRPHARGERHGAVGGAILPWLRPLRARCCSSRHASIVSVPKMRSRRTVEDPDGKPKWLLNPNR